jgi:two-component system chemotaxis response regulator CheB
LIAPGDRHLEIRRDADGVRVVSSLKPPVNSCRPAADLLFSTAARTWGAQTLAVALTGMGRDGLAGCREIRRVGGQVIAQDRDTSVVWGIPGQVAGAGLADAVLPLEEIGPEIVRRVERGGRGGPAAPHSES